MSHLIKPDTRFGDLQEVTRLFRQERDTRLSARLNAIRLLLSGMQQQDVARVLDVSDTTIATWTKRWNEQGLEGLRARHQGSRSKVTDEMRVEISEVVEVQQVIDGRTVTGKWITGYLKKNTS
jgi:transposase